MKILFVVSSYSADGAGAGMSVRYLAETMVRMGHQAVVVRLARDDQQRTEHVNGVIIHHRPIFNVFPLSGKQQNSFKRFIWHFLDMFNPWAARDFYSILKKEKPDVVNTSVIAGFSTSLFWVTKLLKIPLVHTLRDYYLMCPQNAMFKNNRNCETICLSCRPFKFVRSCSARQVDLFLANSDFIARHHHKFNGLPESVPCRTQLNMNSDEMIAEPRTYPSGRPFVYGFIGRVTETKGIEILLQAFLKKPTTAKLMIAGYGSQSYIQELKTSFSDPGISFVGHQNADDFYARIDALVCPSLYEEPLPRVVYEAYRAALPVIAARTGGTPEIVEDRKTGFLYEAYDVASLSEHMHSLASDSGLYEAMSVEAARKAETFRPDHQGRLFIQNLEEAIHRAG